MSTRPPVSATRLAMTSDKRSLTFCVPRITPQSISICQGLRSCLGSVIRKQSPNPCRYIRTEARLAAGVEVLRLTDLPVAGFAFDTDLLLCAILLPPSGSMQHGKGLIDPVFAIRISGSHCCHVVLQCALCPIGARNRYRNAVADCWHFLTAIQHQRTAAAELVIRPALTGECPTLSDDCDDVGPHFAVRRHAPRRTDRMHLEAGAVVRLVAAGEIVRAVGRRRSPVQTEGSCLLLGKICRIGEPLMQKRGVGPGRLPSCLPVAPDIPTEIDILSEEVTKPLRLRVGL